MDNDPSADFFLSPHFRFSELTVTNNVQLQEINRIQARALIPALQATAALLESLRLDLGAAIIVNSGFRCPELNGSLPGASKTSQHMLGQAADLHCAAYPLTEAGNDAFFEKVLSILVARNLPFGQIINEGNPLKSPANVWVHISLGAPWRDPAKCGQVMKMRPNPDGSPCYTLLHTVPQPA